MKVVHALLHEGSPDYNQITKTLMLNVRYNSDGVDISYTVVGILLSTDSDIIKVHEDTYEAKVVEIETSKIKCFIQFVEAI